MHRLLLTALFAFALAIPVMGTPAHAADLHAEAISKGKHPNRRCNVFNNFWLFGDPTDCPNDETVPACDAPNVVSAALRFANRAEHVYRIPRVAEIIHPREAHGSIHNPSPLVRRYCTAEVRLDDGIHTTAHYFIEEDGGFVGLSWAVYVCLDGYDKWRVYDGRCRVARPVTRY